MQAPVAIAQHNQTSTTMPLSALDLIYKPSLAGRGTRVKSRLAGTRQACGTLLACGHGVEDGTTRGSSQRLPFVCVQQHAAEQRGDAMFDVARHRLSADGDVGSLDLGPCGLK